MKTTLDISSLAQAIAWPLSILIVVLAYRAHLLELIKHLGGRVKSFSLAGVSVELAEATQLKITTGEATVDLRHAGRSADVNDSTLRSFYEQVREASKLEYAVVDLGSGCEWLTTRLYILSVILHRMRGLQAMVLVETVGNVRRRFLGTCDCERIRWKLAARYPWFEAALALAEYRTWFPGAPQWSMNNPLGNEVSGTMRYLRIVNDDGRIEEGQAWPQPAADLLKHFLDGVQAFAPLLDKDWEVLPLGPGQASPLSEHAQWLSGRLAEELFGDALDTGSVRLRDLQGRPEAEKTRLVLDQPSRWIALLRDDAIFDRLIARPPVVEALARSAMRA